MSEDLHLTKSQFLELQKIGVGAFAPLNGFMCEKDFFSVVNDLHLLDNQFFPLPIYLDISNEDAKRFAHISKVSLFFNGSMVGTIFPDSIFSCDKNSVAKKIFGTDDPLHPGVRQILSSRENFMGGRVELEPNGKTFLFADELSPKQTRAIFEERGWKTVAGFQTRNVPHRAHEYLQRIALEVCDGLFIQPLLGQKKVQDYTPEAIMRGYRILTDNFLPKNRVLLGVLSTAMRYAGPREALFHALIRRNYGCTHFIVGRDHAGIGNYYGKYEAQDLAKQYAKAIGIKILALSGPFHCKLCDGIVTERTCSHVAGDQVNSTTEISGTIMRSLLRDNLEPKPELMRPEIVKGLKGLPIFIDKEEM